MKQRHSHINVRYNCRSITPRSDIAITKLNTGLPSGVQNSEAIGGQVKFS